MQNKEYTVEVEIQILAQSFQITMEAEGVDEADAKRDAEEYVRDNILIVATNAEEEE